jgi:hypothetical protein
LINRITTSQQVESTHIPNQQGEKHVHHDKRLEVHSTTPHSNHKVIINHWKNIRVPDKQG